MYLMGAKPPLGGKSLFFFGRNDSLVSTLRDEREGRERRVKGNVLLVGNGHGGKSGKENTVEE